MKKSFLFLSIVAVTFMSCQKEEVAPQPQQPLPTPTSFDITKTIADFSGGVGVNNGYKVTVANLSSSIIGPDCYSQTIQNQVTFTTDNSYSVTLTNGAGNTTLYTGTISVDSGGNLTITDGAVTTVHLYHQNCSTAQMVLVFQ